VRIEQTFVVARPPEAVVECEYHDKLRRNVEAQD
jgi:hypothetical protein